MKYFLVGKLNNTELPSTVTYGKPYEWTGSTFLNDLGNTELVSGYKWNDQVLTLKEHDNTEFAGFPTMEKSEKIKVKQARASETQVGGGHYLSMGLQPLEACYKLYGYKGLKAAIFTKVMKYINRNKDDEVEQLKKARHCIDILIEKAQEEANNGIN